MSTEIDTVIYESENPVWANRKFCAFLVREVYEVDKTGKRTGRMVYDQLPMVFWGTSASAVDQQARHFWMTETARKREKTERGKALGAARRKKEDEDETA